VLTIVITLQLHVRQGKTWTTSEQAYLIAHYELIGPEQMSLALERTIHTIMTRPERRVMHPRGARAQSGSDKAFAH
jgi:hypothetical protein